MVLAEILVHTFVMLLLLAGAAGSLLLAWLLVLLLWQRPGCGSRPAHARGSYVLPGAELPAGYVPPSAGLRHG